MARLLDDEIAEYHRNGYVIPQFRLPTETVTRLRSTLDELIAERAQPIAATHSANFSAGVW